MLGTAGRAAQARHGEPGRGSQLHELAGVVDERRPADGVPGLDISASISPRSVGHLRGPGGCQ
jgi:hypothetical protein